MQAEASGTYPEVLSQAAEKQHGRCEAEQRRIELPAVLCEYTAEQAAEGRAILGEEDC